MHTKSKSVGLYFVDTVKLGRLFELSGGVRWDRFNTGYNLYQPTPPAGGTVTAAVRRSAGIDEQPSYRAAFVYKPSTRGSVYFDYGTSWDPAAESLSLSVGLVNGNVAPEENESYEAGAKWSFLNERLLMEGAWFRTEKDNAHETRPDELQQHCCGGQSAGEGRAVQRGGPAAGGHGPGRGLRVSGQRGDLSQFFPTAVGYPLANVPKQTFNLFVTHRLPCG